jgi:hypothetical protein
MDVVVRTLTYFLDTKYRTGGSNYQPEFRLANTVGLSSPDNYFECQVLSAEIPYSFNAIATPNNTVRYTMLLNGANTSGVITIPQGNYTITTILATLASAFVAVTSTSATTPTPVFTYNASTGYVTLALGNTSTMSSPFLMTLYWTSSDILAEVFGFYYTVNTILRVTGTADTSYNNVSVNNVNVSPVTSLCLRSDSLHQDVDQVECLVEPVFTQSDILCKIPIQVPANSWIYYENPVFAVRLRNATIELLQFYLTSQTYDAVSFDGVHWRLALQIREKRPAYVVDRDAMDRVRLDQATQRMRELEMQRGQMVDELQRKAKKLRTIAPS